MTGLAIRLLSSHDTPGGLALSSLAEGLLSERKRGARFPTNAEPAAAYPAFSVNLTVSLNQSVFPGSDSMDTHRVRRPAGP